MCWLNSKVCVVRSLRTNQRSFVLRRGEQFELQAAESGVRQAGGEELRVILRDELYSWPCGWLLAADLASVGAYHQRGPLEYPFFRPFPRLVLCCINADFCVQGRIFQRFSSSTFFPSHHSRFLSLFRTFAQFFTEFDAIFAEFQERQQILQIFVKISPNFFRISQNFSDFDRSDVKMMIFHENLRNFAKNFKHFVANILKIRLKKCIV